MTLLRGKGLGLEVVLSQGELEDMLLELGGRLAERPDFYRGTSATVVFAPDATPSDEQLDRIGRMLASGGIVLSGLIGGPQIEGLALRLGVGFAPAAPPGGELERRRALRPRAAVQLSDSARSLDADFDGARKDIAVRRRRGESSVRRLEPRPAPTANPIAPVETPPATLYHVGTLRGGQSLHQIGNIVVVGDVNPGAELVASGDILVFGSLRGVAHAGAQGDACARVFALDLAATQLRIATCIAADAGARLGGSKAESAVVREGRIVIVPFEQLGQLGKGASSH